MASCTDNGTVYELSGPEGAPVVVLIHGLGLNRYTWQWHEAALADRYRVLNYDLFGHGESVPPPATIISIASVRRQKPWWPNAFCSKMTLRFVSILPRLAMMRADSSLKPLKRAFIGHRT